MTQRSRTAALPLCLLVVLAGCATATIAPKVTQPLVFDRTAPLTIGEVRLNVAPGVWMKDQDRTLLHHLIETNLKTNGFRVDLAPSAYRMTVTVTRFDEGNAFARMALIGLGQIHLDGTVAIADANGKPVGEYKVAKTFAGGGVVGAVTTTENVESGFAKSVVAALVAKP